MKKDISISGAQIRFRNFSGKEGRFNPAGRRNFTVLLDDDIAKELKHDGWNVRELTPRDSSEKPQACLQVAVEYKNYPPKIVMVTSRGKSVLDEETVGMLDWVDIENVDVKISPYNWSMGGKSGVKAYVKIMYVTIAEDEFEDKYYNHPDSAVDAVGGCGRCDECDGHCGGGMASNA